MARRSLRVTFLAHLVCAPSVPRRLSPMGPNLPRVALLLTLGALLAGCERGCLLPRLGEAWGEPAGDPGRKAPLGKVLSGTDCSDGLLRCVDGRVEASRAAHIPHPCTPQKTGEKGSCECPWEVAAECPAGCAVEGLEVLGERTDAGSAQLCRPVGAVARRPLPGEGASEVCAAAGYACVGGVVRQCAATQRPSTALATCLHGCAPWVGVVEDGETTNPDGVVSILCRRDDAERR